MSKLFELPDEALIGRSVHGFFDDFDHLVTADRWTDTSGDTTATVSVADGVGGICAVFTDGTDNNEAYLHNTTELFKFADAKPLMFEAYVQYTEANTDDANVLVGLMNAVGANSLVDDGVGPKADYSGACFYKVDGGTNWIVEFSDSTTQQTVELTAANSLDGVAKAAGGSAYQRLRIEFVPTAGSVADVKFFIDDELVYVFNGVSYANATEMEAVVGAKAGDSNAETVNVDYLMAYQKR